MSNTNIQKRIDLINERIEAIYAHDGIELRSSYYANFDYCLDAVTFERIDNETLETIKEYTVTLLDTDEPEIEWNTDSDGGYGCWHRLNKEVRDLVVELYQLNKELEALEEQLESLEVDEVEECEKVNCGLNPSWTIVKSKIIYYAEKAKIVQWVQCDGLNRVYSVWRKRSHIYEINGGEYRLNHGDKFTSCLFDDYWAQDLFERLAE